ncbi:PP2C family protein-serine/threonine phosphatase [Actinomycetota bacterium Odt1-20B]
MGARRWFWDLLPWLIVVAVAVVQWQAGAEAELEPLLAAAPALAAIRGGPRRVLAVCGGVAAAGLVAALSGHSLGTRHHVVTTVAVVGVCLASLVGSAERSRRERDLSQARRLAVTVQRAVLPPMPERAGPLRLAADYHAADAEALIGGDLYEAVALRDRIRLIIGDVRGKGLPAIRTAAQVLGAFRAAGQYEPDLPSVALHCSRAVAQHAAAGKEAEPDEMFVTAALVEIEGPELRLLLFGHPPPLLLTTDTCSPLEAPAAPPLGLAHALDDDPAAYEPHRERWRPGDRLLLYTDGTAEARDDSGRFFPLHRHTATLLGLPTEEVPHALLKAVEQHAGGVLRDDAAVVVAEWLLDQPPLRRGRR